MEVGFWGFRDLVDESLHINKEQKGLEILHDFIRTEVQESSLESILSGNPVWMGKHSTHLKSRSDGRIGEKKIWQIPWGFG
jgi:hypothetical protein